MMLAETLATNFNWTLLFTGIMALATLAMWWDARRQPVKLDQPVRTEKTWPATTAKEFEDAQSEIRRRLIQHDNDISALRELIRVEMPAMERRLGEKNEERTIIIHNRINDVLEAVSELRGTISRQ